MLDLFVGDVHAKPDDLGDCQKLLDFVLSTAQAYKVRGITFMGDQHHTFNILHLAVIGFWRKNIQCLTAAGFPVTLIKGNHDMTGDLSTSDNHANMAYESMPDVTVIGEPKVHRGCLYMPYMPNDEFVRVCRAHDPLLPVICHAEFNGCEYENGFYAKDGIHPESIPQVLVVSGHIHIPQTFGKVEYLGSPRWLTASDANSDRFIYIREPAFLNRGLAIPTGDVCQRIWQVQDHFEKPCGITVNGKDRYIVDIVGPQAWIESRRPLWQGKARIRTSRTDQQIIRLRESEGIEKALVKFATDFVPPNGTPPAVLMGMVQQRLLEVS